MGASVDNRFGDGKQRQLVSHWRLHALRSRTDRTVDLGHHEVDRLIDHLEQSAFVYAVGGYGLAHLNAMKAHALPGSILESVYFYTELGILKRHSTQDLVHRTAEQLDAFMRGLSPIARKLAPWLRGIGAGIDSIRLFYRGAEATLRVHAPPDHLARLLGY